jgi:hypothetical protein
MTTNQHPITPSPEQVDQWFDDAIRLNITPKYYIARQSALWSADQELEACCEWVSPFSHDDCYYEDKLRTARRPKPSSLKEQALEALLNEFSDPEGLYLDVKSHNTIRRALEALDD